MPEPVTWLLWAWLCAGPGPAGECAPLPDRPMSSRGECLRAAAELRAGDARIVAHCRLAR